MFMTAHVLMMRAVVICTRSHKNVGFSGYLWRQHSQKNQSYPITSRVFFYRFAKSAVGKKQPHVQYETTIYRLEKTTLTWSRIVEISNFRIKYTSCHLRISQKYNLKVKILKIYTRDFTCCLAHEIKPQQRICVCLGQITIFRNFMNEDSQKRRQ